MTPVRVLYYLTPAWLAALGVLAFFTEPDTHVKVIAGAEVLAAILWLIRPTRYIGMGLMLLVITAAAVLHGLLGVFPGPLLYYGAVIVVLAWERRRLDRSATPLRKAASSA